MPDKISYRPQRSIRSLLTFGSLLILFVIIIHYSGLFNISTDSLPFFKSGEINLTDVTTGSGLETYTRLSINDHTPAYIEVMGGGIAVGDIDGDGREDIFFTGLPSFAETTESGAGFIRSESGQPSFDMESKRTGHLSALFRNQGDGTFRNITAEAGLDRIKGFPMGALFFDFNNNGRQDLYVAAYQGGQLFKNMGGYFMDITESAGLDLTGLCGIVSCLGAAASAGDYNRDGYLDLLVVNNADWNIDNAAHYGEGTLTPAAYQGQPSFLFRNNGDDTFTNVSEETGVTNQDITGYREDGKGLSAVWADFNNDNLPDIYIANDMSPNRLYLNTGNGDFVETGRFGYVDELKSSMGVDAADFNYSGDMDLVMTNLRSIMTSLYRNYGNLRFDYATFYTGIMSSTRSSGWGIVFVDLDLDGHLDLVMGGGPLWDLMDETDNIFYKNQGNGQFKDVTDEIVHFPNDQVTRGLAVIDFDNSGTPDLIFSNIDGEPSQLLKNSTKGNHWVRLDLEGVISNRDAVGARVTIEREDGLIQNQMVKAGNSYISSGSKSLFFGLGRSEIKELTIQWPSGRADTLNNLNVNEIIHIREVSQTDSLVAVTSHKPER